MVRGVEHIVWVVGVNYWAVGCGRLAPGSRVLLEWRACDPPPGLASDFALTRHQACAAETLACAVALAGLRHFELRDGGFSFGFRHLLKTRTTDEDPQLDVLADEVLFACVEH